MTSRGLLLVAAAALAGASAACSGGDEAGSPSTAPGAASTTVLAVDETAPAAAVDDSILTERRVGSITIGGVTTEFTSAEFDAEFAPGLVDAEFDLPGPEPGPAVLGFVSDGPDLELVVVPVDLQDELPTGELVYIGPGDDARQASDVDFAGTDEDFVIASGSFEDGEEFDLAIGVATGTSTFELDGNRAIVNGDLGSTTFEQVTHLIDNHPEVDTLVLQAVPGSVNDDVNVETGRLVRRAGYTTIVPSDGFAASGGVDLFAAGVERIAEPGARVGIHSWCCSNDGTPVAELPADHALHASQLAYFTEMLGVDAGPEFYFQTLNAAPSTEIHWMTDAELRSSTIATNR